MKLRHGDVLVVDTRAGRVQLDALRRLLAHGFQPHLLHNPLLHQARIWPLASGIGLGLRCKRRG